LGIGFAALVAVVASLLMMSRQGDYRVLFAGLSDKDGGAVVAQLSQMNVPYRHADGGNAILVPADKVHDVRLKLASAGLPKGAVGGFELMDNARFGQTQFQERMTFQRALEGELVRSITSLNQQVSASHGEDAMGKIVETHQSHGNGQSDRGHKQQHAESQAVEKNSDKIEHASLLQNWAKMSLDNQTIQTLLQNITLSNQPGFWHILIVKIRKIYN
jgi:hypothetical protein